MPQAASIRNNSGFTLIELMVAVIIVAVGMFGVLETVNVSLQHNLKNELRNEAVKVGEQHMAEFRGMDFASITDSYPSMAIDRKVRGVSKQYVVERSSLVLSRDGALQPTSRQVTVVVKWAFRNITSQNRVDSVVAKP